MVKRKTSASRRDLSPPRESEPEIASMTMGELALSVPFGRRRVDEEEAAHSNDDEDEDNIGRPQVEIVNGQIVLSTKSLTVHEDELMQEDDETDGHEPHPRLGRAAGRRYLREGWSRSRVVGYLSGRSSSRRWNYIETKQFFYCLSHIGTDFTLMETLFPNRTRAELKLKFKSEEKRHRALVEVALEGAKRPLDADVAELAADNLKQLQAKKHDPDEDDMGGDDDQPNAATGEDAEEQVGEFISKKTHSGLQLQVLGLYKQSLAIAKDKERNGVADSVEFVRRKFREDAASVGRMDFQKIEYLIRKGERQLKQYRQVKGASFAFAKPQSSP
ncbi:hypothetical protein DYB25_002198 [Aphanomyces astaci]|uniref:Uncharacterized protein n=1 Tax=Aphanomyces astaci TaxID=112090 RepID=A0A397EF87_APHAT|nr:hypothetical protein DYB25_002198 [Aphanomyces astaci]RHY46894.1 hypothetical protein DYB34_010408 [Aphanomyces astaci]RHY83111.1 hypothetical protein DYB31_000965 [Aphanomyces astaci]